MPLDLTIAAMNSWRRTGSAKSGHGTGPLVECLPRTPHRHGRRQLFLLYDGAAVAARMDRIAKAAAKAVRAAAAPHRCSNRRSHLSGLHGRRGELPGARASSDDHE